MLRQFPGGEFHLWATELGNLKFWCKGKTEGFSWIDRGDLEVAFATGDRSIVVALVLAAMRSAYLAAGLGRPSIPFRIGRRGPRFLREAKEDAVQRSADRSLRIG